MDELNLVIWLGCKCASEFRMRGKTFNNYWYFKEDAAELYDGEYDNKLKWYSNEEILEIYKNEQNGNI